MKTVVNCTNGPSNTEVKDGLYIDIDSDIWLFINGSFVAIYYSRPMYWANEGHQHIDRFQLKKFNGTVVLSND